MKRIREPFGKAGLIVAIVALVAALVGGAYAASAGRDHKKSKSNASLTGKQKTEVKTIAKSYQGTGPAGPQGPVGSQGAQGSKGDAGGSGKDGSPGKDGADGKSIEITPVAVEEPECDGRGGAILEEEGEPLSATEICTGEEGSPWTAGGTLPPGSSETGAWSFTADSTNGDTILAPISFTIPLAEPLFAAHVHFQGLPTEEAFEAACPAGAFGAGAPTANPGELCVYVNDPGFEPDALFNATFTSINPPTALLSPGAKQVGAVIRFAFSGSAGEDAHGFGTWAVTGCGAALPVGDPNKCP